MPLELDACYAPGRQDSRRLGVGLWRSKPKQLSCPPWAPCRGYAALCVSGREGPNSQAAILVMGGMSGGGVATNRVWWSTDLCKSWQEVESKGPRWCPRSNFGAAVGTTFDNPPSTILYVVGGLTSRAIMQDVWASDTAGRRWRKMSSDNPFGRRCDMQCCVVSTDCLRLVVAGGVEHGSPMQDVYLSIDAGEHFSRVAWDAPLGFVFTGSQPLPLCVAKIDNLTWSVWEMHYKEHTGCLELVDQAAGLMLDEAGPPPLGEGWRVTVDLSLSCLVVRMPGSLLSSGEYRSNGAGARYQRFPGGQLLLDMSLPHHSRRHGRLFSFSEDGQRIWISGEEELRAQLFVFSLVGVRLVNEGQITRELWQSRILPLVFPPRRAHQASGCWGISTCPMHHGLERHTVPGPGWTCDACGAQMQVGIEAFGCRVCNYDICASCRSFRVD